MGCLKNVLYSAATNHRFWPAGTGSSRNDQVPSSSRQRASTTEIKTAAYAVLAQIKNNDIAYANPVVSWLVTQRNAYGAFVSTQVCRVLCGYVSYHSITILRHIEFRSFNNCNNNKCSSRAPTPAGLSWRFTMSQKLMMFNVQGHVYQPLIKESTLSIKCF